MTPLKNPFVYGRVLTAKDAACVRADLEARVLAAIRDNARIALVGDRRMGKSSLVHRTLEAAGVPMLRLSYHEVVDMGDLILRTVTDFERLLRERSVVAKKLAPWLKEIGLDVREIRASFAGVELSGGLGVPTDHLKRVFGLIRDAASRDGFVLFIDELQDVCDRLPEQVGRAALAIIRDEVQQMPDTPVFFAGSARDSFTLLFSSPASPLFEHATLVHVEAIPTPDLAAFIRAAFAKAHGIEEDAVHLILTIAGDSPNDVQRLCHETWNEHLAANAAANRASVQAAFGKVLKDFTPLGEKWLSDLSTKQQRIVFTVAFMEHAGASTREFMEFAGVRNPGETPKALGAISQGKEALIEKVGSKYRFRSRYARLWFALRSYQVQGLIPALRTPDVYRRRVGELLPEFPLDPYTAS